MRLSGLMSSALFGLAVVATCLAANADVPANARDFVAFCSSNEKACHDKIVTVDDVNLLIKTGLATKPASQAHACEWGRSTHEQFAEKVKAVLDWLKNHPEEDSLSTDDAINDALAALWPC